MKIFHYLCDNENSNPITTSVSTPDAILMTTDDPAKRN